MDDDLGVAWLVKRVVTSRILRGKPAPDINDVDNTLLEGTSAGRLVWASMVPDIIGKIVGRGELESSIAETYSYRLGEDLDAVSLKAAKEGYTASLSKGIDKSLSWARVAEAWGLDGSQMRSFIGSMKDDAYSTDVIPKRSARQLEVMLNTRADRIRDNESYSINQIAQQVHWIKLQQTGQIGPDVRKQWHTAADEFVCPVCGPIDGVIVPISDVFSEGVFAPPVHPNCRCWTEIIESTVVTKRDYKRDQDGKFAAQNTLVRSPFGRDTFGNPRPHQADIARMRKETAPLKGGKGGYDIVGNPKGVEGVQGFGPGFGLVPTRDERYYQMHYRDWYDKKVDHDLFSPDEYYARIWEMGKPYTQPKEEDIFTPEERADRAKKFKDIEDRWAQNVAQANKEGRAPAMPSEEDLRDYWPWDEGWSGSQGKWEGKYREFHPSEKAPPVSEHRMHNELKFVQQKIDEKNKTLPEYKGLTKDGKKISYEPLPREYDDEFGTNPQNYPLRDVKQGDPAWDQFSSDYATPEGAKTAFRNDPEIVGLIDRENRARKGAELYRQSQKVKTLTAVHNSGSERNSKRLPINPKKYQQKAKLRSLRSDIERQDKSIRENLKEVRKSATLTDRKYNRDPEGKFATVNTLTPVAHTGPSLPKRKKVISPPRLMTKKEMRRVQAVADGRVITTFDQEKPAVEQLNDIVKITSYQLSATAAPKFFLQEPHPDVTNKVAEVSQIIYDSKTRAGKKPKYKLKPKAVKMEVAAPVEPEVTEPETVTPVHMPLESPAPTKVATKTSTFASKPQVLGDDQVIIAVLPKTLQDSVQEGSSFNFSDLPALEAYNPKVVNIQELGLEDTDQVLLIKGATWHPDRSNDGTGVPTGSYEAVTYRYIDEDAAAALGVKNGVEAFVMRPSDPRGKSVPDVVNPDEIPMGGTRIAPDSYDDFNTKPSKPIDPMKGGAVLGGHSGRNYKVEAKEKKWLKDEGLSQRAVEPEGYVDFSSTQTPFKKDNVLKRLPMPSHRKVL